MSGTTYTDTTAATAGLGPARAMADPYSRIADLDAATVNYLAERLETRGSDPRQQRLWRDFLSRLPALGGGRVLEVGCGTGLVTQQIAGLPGVAETTGIDPSSGLVEYARRRLPHARFEVADGRDLPFDNETFDAVVFATTLCHIPEPDRALAEAHRVLRPKGCLLVYDGDYATTTVALTADDPLEACVRAAVQSVVYNPWLIRDLASLVRSCGYQPDELHSHGHIEQESPTYMLSIVDHGTDQLQARGTISETTAATLKDEARRRAAAGAFFGFIAYASLLAIRD
jgi:ubiquinone/menaquinone biosynthesis C-methylase UbiE